MKTKLIIAASVALILSGATAYAISESDTPGSAFYVEPQDTRIIPPEPTVTPPVELPPSGQGLIGEENPDIAVPEQFWIEITLPFINDAGLPQGSGFVLKGSDLPAETELVATVKPRPEANTAPIEVGSVTTDASGELDDALPIPTNISKGAYTMVLTGADEEITFDFTVIGAGEHH